MEGIRSILVRFVVLTALVAFFCTGGIPAAPFVDTAYAEETEITAETTEWSGEMSLKNGYVTIENTVTLNADTCLTVDDGCTLAVKGGIKCPYSKTFTLTIEGEGTVVVSNNSQVLVVIEGNVTLKGGTLTVTVDENVGAGSTGIVGDITLEGGKLTVTGGEGSINGGDGIWGNVTQSGGTLNATGGDGGDSGGNGIRGNVTLNGGTLTATGGDGGDSGGNGIWGNVTQSGGTLNATGGEGGEYGRNGIRGNVTLNGGTLNATGGRSENGKGGDGIYSGPVILNGGILTVTGGVGSTPGLAFNANGECVVQTGTDIYYTDYTRLFTYKLRAEDKSYINGRTLRPCPRGTVAVAKTTAGETFHSTVQEAIDAAAGGGTVTLLDDVTIADKDHALTVSGNLTLDLNNNYILYNSRETNSNSTQERTILKVLQGGTLRLDDTAADKTTRYVSLRTGRAYGIHREIPDVYTEGVDYLTVTGGLIAGGYSSEDFEGGGVNVCDGGTFFLSGGTICGNYSEGDGGGVAVNDRGTFTMSGGTICGNFSEKAGGGVAVLGVGTFTMSGGTIRSNTSNTANGGGVAVNYGGTFTMSDGEIRGNKSNRYGGGVFVDQNASFTMTGGRITGNDAYERGGGVDVGVNVSEKGLFSVSGCAVVTGNTRGGSRDGEDGPSTGNVTDNVHLLKDTSTEALITVIGALEDGANIGVSKGTLDQRGRSIPIPGDFAMAGTGYRLTHADIEHFSSDNSAYAPILNEAGMAELRTVHRLTVVDGHAERNVYAEGALVTVTANSAPEGKRFTGWDGAGGLVFTLGDASTPTAAFTMPDRDLSLTARYEDIMIYYTVTVINGSGGGRYAAGDTVTVTADPAPEGKAFDRWTSTDGVDFKDANAGTTSFTMPGRDVTVTAAYKEGGNDNPEPEKEPDKVPLTDPGQTYASSDDNFAPVAPEAKDGVGGNIKKLELDFSKVAASGVDPAGLKMTVIGGSRLTTKAKLQGRDTFSMTGGVKVKVGKDLIPKITCKGNGTATLILEGGGTYTVSFTVQKPKAQKSEKKMTLGGGPVKKTVRQLFGTDIDGGKLEIVKQKHNQASGADGNTNTVTINPAEKDKIKLQYRYLNKKYTITITVK